MGFLLFCLAPSSASYSTRWARKRWDRWRQPGPDCSTLAPKTCVIYEETILPKLDNNAIPTREPTVGETDEWRCRGKGAVIGTLWPLLDVAWRRGWEKEEKVELTIAAGMLELSENVTPPFCIKVDTIYLSSKK